MVGCQSAKPRSGLQSARASNPTAWLEQVVASTSTGLYLRLMKYLAVLLLFPAAAFPRTSIPEVAVA